MPAMPAINKILFFTLFICLLYGCKPYNSDEASHKLIQGKWMLVDAEREGYDTVKVDYSKQITYLIFNDSKCTQQLVDLDEASDYSFSVRNFNLELYKDSVLYNSLHINMLTSDSLVLSNGTNSLWKYIKMER
jgi:hypothetical protein